MNSFWNWLLGDELVRDGTPRLQWAGMPESWGVFVLLAVVLLILAFVFWLYKREIDTCPRPVKFLLAGLRFSVMAILILLFLRPSIVFTQTSTIKPSIVVLRDKSRSFSRQDQYADLEFAKRLADATGRTPQQIAEGQASRAQLFQEAITKDNNAILKKWREKGSLRIVDFADFSSDTATLAAINTEKKASDEEAVPEADFPLLTPTGLGTDIRQGLSELLAESKQISSIVLISDGQHNASDGPMEAAKRAKDLGIPIHTVGVGDPSRPRNLSVTRLYVNDKTRVNDPFEVISTLYVEDYDGSQIEVELLQHMVKSTGEVATGVIIDTKNIAVPEGGGRVEAKFKPTVDQAGTYAYSVKITEVDGESNAEDNVAAPEKIEVTNETTKVLLIAGAPTWEYRYLQRLFQNEETIVLSCLMQSIDKDRTQDGNVRINKLPQNLEELGQYDVIVMIDPNPNEFTEEWMTELKRFCKRNAGGLFYMAGPKYSNMFVTLNRLKGFRDILPVRFGDDEFIETSQILAASTNSRPGKMLVVQHNLNHPVMSFSEDFEENVRLWSLMPSIYWSFPTQSAKPTALTLMERGDQVSIDGNQPLLVAGRYGAGKVIYMGFNGTWRWRRVGARAQYFERFWMQAIDHLIDTRSLQGQRRGRVDTDRNSYEVGEKVTLTVIAQDERFEDLKAPTLGAIVQSDDGRVIPIELKLVPGQEGSYEGSFVAQNTGNFTVNVQLEGTDDKTGIEKVEFYVKPPSVESRAYWLNEKQLRDIADASGGKYFTLDQLNQIYDSIPIRETTSEYSSPPQPVWDLNKRIRFLTFLLPFLLLTLEWAIRKKYRLL